MTGGEILAMCIDGVKVKDAPPYAYSWPLIENSMDVTPPSPPSGDGGRTAVIDPSFDKTDSRTNTKRDEFERDVILSESSSTDICVLS